MVQAEKHSERTVQLATHKLCITALDSDRTEMIGLARYMREVEQMTGREGGVGVTCVATQHKKHRNEGETDGSRRRDYWTI